MKIKRVITVYWGFIQYKDTVWPVEYFPLWRWDDLMTHLHNENSYTGKTSLYWIGAHDDYYNNVTNNQFSSLDYVKPWLILDMGISSYKALHKANTCWSYCSDICRDYLCPCHYIQLIVTSVGNQLSSAPRIPSSLQTPQLLTPRTCVYQCRHV